MKPGFIYCYDAYCGWCYGFSPVIKRIAETYSDRFTFEVLSGGMIITDQPRPVSAIANYIQKDYKTIEQVTGVRFGDDYLWHIFNPDESDWFPNSEKPAIALCVAKEYRPELTVYFAADLQYALHFEGRDLGDDQSYLHLLEKYEIPADEFYQKLHSEEFREMAYYEFSLCRQLRVTGFPTLLLQVTSSKFYLVTRGYADYDTVVNRIHSIEKEISSANPEE